MDQPWKSKHCVRLRISHCWVHCSHGRCLGKKVPFLNLTPWQCCSVLRWAWFLVITPNYYLSSTTPPTGHIPIEWIQVCHQYSGISPRYLLDPSASLHLMVTISVQVTSYWPLPASPHWSPHVQMSCLTTQPLPLSILQHRNHLAAQCDFWWCVS